jgi:hypothetical protein
MNSVAFIVNVYEEPMKMSNIIRNPTDEDIDDLVDICFEMDKHSADEHFIIHLNKEQIKTLEQIVE